MATVASESELIAALDLGEDIVVDGSEVIDLTRPIELSVPGTRMIGGRFRRTTDCAIRVTASDVVIDGARITGGRQVEPTYDITQKLIRAQGVQANPLRGVAIRDCHLRDSRADNVWLDWCVDSSVHGSDIARFSYSGVMVISGDRVRVSNCTVSDAPLSPGVVNTYGIAFTDMDNTESGRSRDCSAIGNTISFIDWEAIDDHGSKGTLISGNTIIGCPRGIALVVGNETRVAAPERSTVVGNNIDARGMRVPEREGIILHGGPGQPASAVISGNSVTGYQNPFVLNYVERGKTYVGHNNVPFVSWKPVLLDGDFRPNTTFPPQYMIDGNVVHLRGAVIPLSNTRNDVVGRIPHAHGWPDVLTMVSMVQGSNASTDDGFLGVSPTGELRMYYEAINDGYSYWLNGSYVAQ